MALFAAGIKNLPVPEVKTGRRDGFGGTSPVGSYPANRIGLHDLGGNVWEWCEEWMDRGEDRRVARGASWMDTTTYFLMSSCRAECFAKDRSSHFGFRIVLTRASSP